MGPTIHRVGLLLALILCVLVDFFPEARAYRNAEPRPGSLVRDVVLIAIAMGFSWRNSWAVSTNFSLIAFASTGAPYLLATVRKSHCLRLSPYPVRSFTNFLSSVAMLIVCCVSRSLRSAVGLVGAESRHRLTARPRLLANFHDTLDGQSCLNSPRSRCSRARRGIRPRRIRVGRHLVPL